MQSHRIGKTDEHLTLNATVVLRRHVNHVPLMSLHEHRGRKRARMPMEEFAQKHGASQKDIDRLIAHCTKFGLQVRDHHRARRHVRLTGTVAQYNAAFNIELTDYQTGDEIYRHHEPIVLESVVHVDGLSNAIRAKKIKPIPAANQIGLSGGPKPPNTVGLTPFQLAQLYQTLPNAASGQTIGIYGFGAISPDLAATLSAWGYPYPDTQVIYIDGASQAVGIGEETLDLATLAAFAQLAKLVVYVGNATYSRPDGQYGGNILDMFSRMVHPAAGDPHCDVLSFSVILVSLHSTIENTFLAACEPIFEDAATLGISIFCATGDQGSCSYQTDGLTHVGYPSESPWITAVGGTVIGNVTNSNTQFTEWAWQGSGGGVSTVFPVPAYQASLALPSDISTGIAGRATPDISGMGSPESGLTFTTDGVQSLVGGTSFTAPLYAAMTATMNTALGYDVGFLNPTYYSLGSASKYIRDINADTGGALTNSEQNTPGYPVLDGYDCVTGLGVVNPLQLYNYFLGLNTPVTTTTGYTVIVQAINVFGQSAYSLPFTVIAATASPTPPGSPTPVVPAPTPTVPTTIPQPPSPTPPAPTPTLTESPSGTEIDSAGGAGGRTSGATQIVDVSKNRYTLIAGTNGTQIAINGIVDAPTANVAVLLYYKSIIYHENAAGNWYQYLSIPGSYAAIANDPRIVITPPAPPGGSPGPPGPPGTMPIPSQASAAGFTNTVFFDDFTNPATIAPNSGVTSGYNWYWNTQIGVSASNFQVNTTATAASTGNGNSGSGSNASSGGGILHLIGQPGNGGNQGLLNTCATSTQSASGQKAWRGGYFECYLQFNPSTYDGNGWPGFWSWALPAGEITEVDFMEYSGDGSYGAIHEWLPNGGGQANAQGVSSNIRDANWHTYACLWKLTGSDTSTVQWFYDNAPIGGVVNTGSGTLYPALGWEYLYIALSAGVTNVINVDWVRVLQ